MQATIDRSEWQAPQQECIQSAAAQGDGFPGSEL